MIHQDLLIRSVSAPMISQVIFIDITEPFPGIVGVKIVRVFLQG
jgi:hypothetical protein